MSDPSTEEPSEDRLDERPPLLGSWTNLYAVVLANLALLVAVFWWIHAGVRTMTGLDWAVLLGTIAFIAGYGTWKTRHTSTARATSRARPGLAHHRTVDHGHPGQRDSPSSRCPARRTKMACASCSSTSGCPSRW